jgi:tetratricopeptide (TPR) repeat protein
LATSRDVIKASRAVILRLCAKYLTAKYLDKSHQLDIGPELLNNKTLDYKGDAAVTKHLDKNEVRKPDVVTEQLKEGFSWTQKHSQTVIGLVLAFVVLGGGYGIFSYFAEQKELKVQSEFYTVERQYLDKKQKFEEATIAQDKAKKEPAKKDAAEAKSESTPALASGDIEKDYGTEVKGLKDIIAKYPTSQAAKMAALTLSEIQVSYKLQDQALESLSVLNKNLSGNDLLSALVLSQTGNLMAEKQDCKSAIGEWEKVVKNNAAQFLHDEVQLRMGICYESLSDFKKAEELYGKVSTSKPDSVTGKTAEKYKRLLKSKTTGG